MLVVLVVLVVWNVVFDNRMKAAIVQYVHLQQLYVAGAGPRIDVDRAMQEGVRRGLRDATIAAAAAAAVVAALARRRGPA